MIKLYAADTDVFSDIRLFDAYYQRLPAYRKEKTDACRLAADKRLSLGAGALLDFAIKESGMGSFAHEAVCYGENGKPFFENADFHFNLSHSGSMAICAICDSPVGCDIEKIRKGDLLKIADRFFCEEEKAFVLEAAGEDERTRRFFRVWTLKESYVKAEGKSLFASQRSFSILPEKGGGYSFKSARDSGRYDFFEFDDFPGYCFSCCIADKKEGDYPVLMIKEFESEPV